MAGDAVLIELVSSQIPCKQGILQGNWQFGRPETGPITKKTLQGQRFPRRFPTLSYREMVLG